MADGYAEKYTRDWTIERELRRTIIDRIRGNEPTTVLGLLMSQPETGQDNGTPHPDRWGMTHYDIAGQIGQEPDDVLEIVKQLEGEDLAITIVERGLSQVHAVAFFSERNGSAPFVMPAMES